MCNEQVQQLEKKLREGTDLNQASVQPVRGKWSTINNLHEERYQGKLQDIQKDRRAATEVSRAFLTFLTGQKQHICIREAKGPIKRPVDQWLINWGDDTRDSYLTGGCQVVSRWCLVHTGKKSEILLTCLC